MFKKLFTKKGSAEIVSIVLAIVIIGGLALAVTGGLSTSTKESLAAGLNKQNEDVGTTYSDAITLNEFDVTPPGFAPGFDGK